MLILPAHAATRTWTNASGGDFNTDGNWGTVPVAADTGVFNLALSGDVTLSAPATPGSLQFDTNASSFSLGSLAGNSLTFANAGSLSVQSTLTGTGKTFTVNAPIVLTPASGTTAGAFTIQNNATSATNTLVVAGGISSATTSNTETLTLAGTNTGANTISGAITKGSATTFAVTKSGAGTWILAATGNSYNGATSVAAGTLNLTGSLTGNTAITTHSTGAFTQSSTGVISGTSTFNQFSSATSVLAGTNTYTGATNVSAGILDLGGGTANGSIASATLNLDGGAFNYTRTGNTTQTFTTTNIRGNSSVSVVSGNILNLGQIVHGAGGVIDFGSTGAGTVTALTTSNTNGIIAGAVFGGTTWAVANGAGTGITGLASYTNDTWSTLANVDVTTNSTQTSGSTANSLRFNTAEANTVTLAGTNTLTSAGILVTSAVGSNEASITGGTLQGASGKDLVVIQNNAAGALNIGSVIQNNTSTTGLTKSGAGTLNLSATGNTYTGATKVSAGTLNLTGSLTGSTAISTIGTGVFSQSIAGVISGSSSFTQGSSGTSVLAGNNSYTGATTVSTGILNIQHANALGTTAGSTSVSAGAQLQVQGGITVAEALVIFGSGINSRALRSVSGDNTLSGTLTSSSGNLDVDAGSKLSITNTVTSTIGQITLLGAGDFNISGNITGTRLDLGSSAILNAFTGTATFSGDNSGLNNSLFHLFSGMANFNSATAAGGANSTLTFASAGGIDNTSGAAITLVSNQPIGFANVTSPVTTYSTAAGTANNSINLGTGAVSLRAHTLNLNGAGSLTFGGVATNVGGSSINVGSANTVGANITLTVNNGSSTSGTFGALSFGGLALSSSTDTTARIVTIGGSGTVNITGAVTTGNAAGSSLTKSGTGTLTLSAANTYTGVTSVAGGTLLVKNSGSGFTQALNALTLAGPDVIFKSEQAGTGTLSTSFTSLTARTAGNSANIVSTGGTNGVDNSILLTAQGAGFIDKGVYFNGADFAAMNATGTFVRGMNYATTGGDLNTVDVNTVTASKHVKLTSTPASQAANTTLLSLNLAGSGVDYTMNGGTTLTVPGIIKSGGGSLSTISGGTGLTAGTNTELVVRTDTSADLLAISSALTQGSGQLTKSGAGTLTLSGTNTYTGATNINGGTLSIGSNVNLGAQASGASLNLKGGTLQATGTFGLFNGTAGTNNRAVVLTNASSIDVTGSNTLTVAGVVSGAGIFTKTNTGTLSLTGANSYTGSTTVAAGVLNLQNATALGTVAAGTTVASGAALQIQGDITVGDEALTLFGTGVANDGVLRNVSGANTYGGLITLGAASRINADAGSLTLSNTGTITGAGFDLTVGGAGDTTLAGILGTTSGGLTKDGLGTLTLNGANTFTGLTTVSAGTLAFNATAALGATASVSLGNATTLTYAGAASTTLDRAITVSSGTGTLRNTGPGTLTLSGTLTKTGTTLKFAQGLFEVTGTIAGASANSDLVVDAATVTLSGVNTYNGPTFLRNGAHLTAAVAGALPTAIRSDLVLDDTGSGSSTFTLGADQVAASLAGAASSSVVLGSRALTVGSSGGSTTFAGTLSGSGGSLTKDGASTLILAGSSTYTGATTISAGTLQAGAVNALSATSALTLANTAGANLALNNFSQAIGSLAGGGSSGGNVALGSATLTTGGNATSTSYAGVISGSGGLTKTGSGTLSLTGANTYSGATTVSAGTLSLHAASGAALANTNGLTIGSGATVSLGADNQIAATAHLTLAGGTLALGGFNQTLGTLDLSGASILDFSGTSTLAFADSSALTWSATTLTISDFHVGTGTLRFGTSATGLTTTQLGRFQFLEFGNSAARIDANGFLAPLSLNYSNVDATDLVIDTPITGTTTVTQSGSGSTTLTAPASTPNTSTGLASVTQGTLVIGTAAGGNWAGNVSVSGSGILKGRGTITGAVVVDAGGTYSPGNSPAIQNVGSLTVNTGGTVVIELDGATAGTGSGFHDKVISAGAVTLNGGTLTGSTIFTGSTSYVPAFGDSHTVITGSTITGTFEAYNFAVAANASGVSWLPEYTATTIKLFAVPDNYATLAGLTPNQTRIGAALQSLRNAGDFELDQRTSLDARSVLFNGLKTKDSAGLRTAYDQLSPEKFTALSAATFQSASILNSGLQQRSAELRRFGPGSVSLNGVATPAPAQDYHVDTVIEDGVRYQVATAKATRRVGYFAGASGAFTSVDGGAGRPGSFSQTGAAHWGLDYTLNANQSVGLLIGQSFAETDFAADGGTGRTATSRVGFFHDYHRDGFYLNSMVSAGFSTYETTRKIGFLDETARGETQGASFGGQLAAGYEFNVGGWRFGPKASLAYDLARIDGVTETASAAGLSVGRQRAEMLTSFFGFQVNRPLVWQGIGWIPEASLGVSRQHFNPNAITARLNAGGDSFGVKPEGVGSEFVNPGMGLTTQWASGWSVKLGYEAILNRNAAEHRVNLSVNAGF